MSDSDVLRCSHMHNRQGQGSVHGVQVLPVTSSGVGRREPALAAGLSSVRGSFERYAAFGFSLLASEGHRELALKRTVSAEKKKKAKEKGSRARIQDQNCKTGEHSLENSVENQTS